MPPLQPQTIPVLFGKLDSKTAPRLAQQGTFVELLNCQMKQTGRVQKRPGYGVLSSGPVGLAARHMVPFGNELIVQDASQLYSFNAAAGTLAARGEWGHVQPTCDFVVSNATSQNIPDAAAGGGLECYVWEDTRSSGQIRYSVRNQATGQYVVSDQLLAGSGVNFTSPKVIFTASRFLVFYTSAVGTLKAATILVTSPGTPSAPTTITADLDNSTPSNWDVSVRDVGEVLLAFKSQSGAGLKVQMLNAITLAVALTNAGPFGAVPTSLGWLRHSYGTADNNVYLALATSTSALLYKFDTFMAFVDSTTVDSGLAAAPTQIHGWTDALGAPTVRTVVYQKPGASSKTLNDVIGKGVSTTTGDNVTTARLAASVGMASRIFMLDGAACFLATYEGGQNTSGALTIQQTYFVVRASDGKVLARLLSSTGTGMRSRVGHLASVITLTGSTVALPVTQKVQVATENNLAVIVKSVARVLLNSADTGLSPPRAAGQGLIVPGGFPVFYDGGSVAELGFHVSPEKPIGVTAVATAGSLSGDYKYIYTYEWFDNRGQRHISSPSVSSAAVTVNTGAGNHSTSHTIPTLRLTAKSNVIVNIWRQNPGSDTNYYRVTSVTSPVFNDPTVDTVSFTDSISDAEAASREALYTTGGVLPNNPPPPCRVVGVYRDRVALTAQDTPSKLWLSKNIVNGSGVAFSSSFELATDPVDGEPVAFNQLDDKAVVFFPASISYFGGDGPDATNRNGSWSDFVRLAGGQGTSAPGSVLRTQEGLLFSSTNSGGVYLLDRGLAISYRGSDVEAYNGLVIGGGVVLPDLNHTRLVSTSGTMLVRDDYHQRWCVWDQFPAVDCCEYQGLFTWVAADGTVYQETPSAYLDAGSAIKSRLTLAWLNPFGPGGQGRLWRVHIIGDYVDPHTLRLGIRYDHADAITWETLAIDTSSVAGTAYGADSPYGTGVYGGSGTGDYRFEARPAKQRGSAFQFVIEDNVSDSSDSAGLDLSALALLVGTQPGTTGLLPAGRQMVTS